MRVYAIRGAITVDADTDEKITEASVELIRKIKEKNPEIKDVVSIVMSTTEDIRSFYPARAVRESGVMPAPIFSCKEPEIDGALKLCIRALVTVTSDDDGATASHVYLGGAKELRKDLAR